MATDASCHVFFKAAAVFFLFALLDLFIFFMIVAASTSAWRDTLRSGIGVAVVHRFRPLDRRSLRRLCLVVRARVSFGPSEGG